MSATASYILALTFIFLPLVSSLNKGKTKTTHEIAYGTVVDYSIVKTSYSFMVRIILDGSFRCGGALISDRFVATARHCLEFCPCFDEANPSSDWTRCGKLCILKLRENSDYISDTETVHTIKTIYLPQNSGSPYDTRGQRTDFALVELAASANICSQEETERDRCWKVSPVRLPEPYSNIKEGQRVRTLGWGATELSFDDEQSEFLAQLDITVNSSTLFHFLLETNVGRNGADPCRGDSGGPLLLRGEDLEWTLVGTLVGGGYECGNPGSKDTSSDWNKVALHVPWINSVMGTDTVMSTETVMGTDTVVDKPGIMLNPVVLLTGGASTGRSVEVYSPLESCNKDLEDIPYEFTDHSINFFNGEIIICGGQGSSSSRCLFLDQNQRFIQHSQLSERHIYHVGAVVSDTLIIVGGQALPDQGNNTVETWNGSRWEKRSFDEIDEMQTQSCMDAISRDTLLMVGGLSVNGRKYTNKMLKYYKADKDQDGVWEQMEDFPGPESWGLGCAFIQTPEGDSFLIAGGSDYKKTSYLYNIHKNKWEEVGRLSHARLGGKIVVVDGKVLMLGGSYAPTTVEEYNVESKTWSQIEQRIKQSRGQFDAVVVPGALVGC